MSDCDSLAVGRLRNEIATLRMQRDIAENTLRNLGYVQCKWCLGWMKPEQMTDDVCSICKAEDEEGDD